MLKWTTAALSPHPTKTITDADYADDIAILANTPDQAETLLHSLERAAAGIGLYVNAHKTEYMCYNQILNKSWRQHPTRHQLYGHLLPITKTIQVRQTRHAGHCWRSRDELIRDVLLLTPTRGRAKAGRPVGTYIQQLCEDTGCFLKTCLGRWTIGRSGERGSGISVLPARHDIYIFSSKIKTSSV